MTIIDRAAQIPVRLDFDAHAAGFARAMAQLDKAATKELDRVNFDPRLRELVRVRASQLNGCAYCMDMHTTDARAVGESEHRLYALPAWAETPYSPSGSGPRSPSPSRSPCSPPTTSRLRPTTRWPHSSAPTRSPPWSASSSPSTPGTPSA